MKGNLFWLNLKLMANHKTLRIGSIVLLFIPLLYTGMFLAGYWDPYGHMDKLPVAIVNEDKGAVSEGKELHLGQDIVDNMKSAHTLDYHFVERSEAEKGLYDGDYYLTIVIPDNFSQSVTTLTEEHPQPADLVYMTNPGNNYVSGQIGSNVLKELTNKVSQNIVKSYTQTVYGKMQQMADGFSAASSGAEQLAQGTESAQDGVSKLNNAIASLASGAGKLSDSMKPLRQGIQQLASGAAGLSTGTASLNDNLSKLKSAGQQLADGANALQKNTAAWNEAADSATKAASGVNNSAESLQSQIKAYMEQHPELKDDTAFAAIVSGSEKLAQDADDASKSVEGLKQPAEAARQSGVKLAAGQSALADGLAQAYEGSGRLAAGSAQLKDGLNTSSNGIGKLQSGIHQLAGGAQQLNNGSQELLGGVIRLVDGSQQLTDKLSVAAQSTAGIKASDAELNMYAQPVQLEQKELNTVKTYATGSAPYFLALGLLVGSLMASNIIHFQEGQVRSAWQKFWGRIGVFYLVALLQTIVLDLIVLYAIGLDVQSVPKFFLFTLVTACAFTTLILMLVAIFGTLGKLVGIALVVTQLASSGGTFPMELAPQWIQSVGQCLPMTYVLRGMKSVISTSNWDMYWSNTGILLAFLAGFAVIMLAAYLLRSAKEAPAAPAAAH
ncbi:phage infection protein [Paenibacillus glycanilyticus]|uniref:Phage infection protein n=1 Tax=Paenibacillus glycanilyticus TaxID=126569 RepID=A0ABQ6NKK8_9BACL|nr:YhgE/Pip domain-containing protein [Paenibacillus glycanilyticus]GMK45616.1 phage infection protein [Paenibacillus glycanilyticus]